MSRDENWGAARLCVAACATAPTSAKEPDNGQLEKAPCLQTHRRQSLARRQGRGDLGAETPGVRGAGLPVGSKVNIL